VVHVELSVVHPTGRIVVVGRPLIGELVVAEQVPQLHVLGQVPREAELRAVLVELLPVQAIRGRAQVGPVNFSGKDAVVVGRRERPSLLNVCNEAAAFW